MTYLSGVFLEDPARKVAAFGLLLELSLAGVTDAISAGRCIRSAEKNKRDVCFRERWYGGVAAPTAEMEQSVRSCTPTDVKVGGSFQTPSKITRGGEESNGLFRLAEDQSPTRGFLSRLASVFCMPIDTAATESVYLVQGHQV